jgi:hypothetical protein
MPTRAVCLLCCLCLSQVVFTDHSLFGFADAVSIVMNRLLECVLADVQHVSHTKDRADWVTGYAAQHGS